MDVQVDVSPTRSSDFEGAHLRETTFQVRPEEVQRYTEGGEIQTRDTTANPCSAAVAIYQGVTNCTRYHSISYYSRFSEDLLQTDCGGADDLLHLMTSYIYYLVPIL